MSKCIYCGNNPVSHASEYFDTSLASLMNDLLKHIPVGLSSGVVNSTNVTRFFIGFFSLIGIAAWSEDISNAPNDRGKVLWGEATRRNIPMKVVRLFGKSGDMYKAIVKGKELFFSGIPRPARGSNWNTRLDDKAIVKEKLAVAGITVPRGGRASTFKQALDIFRAIEKPVVIKPRIGSRGRHTTTHITTEAELYTAFTLAKQLCHWAVVEEHLTGSVYRSTLVEYVSEGILRGDPPRVTGDGVHTIVELVELKNSSRHPRVHAVTLSSAHTEHLARTGRKESDILPKGETIDLIEKIGISYGGLSADDTARMHPDTKRMLEKAARVLGDPIVGLDFIIPDIAASPFEQKWGVIECNAVPFINLHHDPVEGESRNVAGKVWDYVERHIDEF